MEAAHRETCDHLTTVKEVDSLLGSPDEWSFFSLVRLLEVGADDSAVSLGEAGPAQGEAVRFRGCPSLSFPARDVVQVLPLPSSSGSPRYEVEVAFLSLCGVDSPLAPCYVEEILRNYSSSPQVRDFLDIFNHRLISLFFRTWKRYRLHSQGGRWGEDRLSRHVEALLTRRDEPYCSLSLAGLWFQRPRSRAGLETVLFHHFPGIPIAILEFLPRRVCIDVQQRCRLGVRGSTLGVNILVGETAYEASSKFRLQIGPLKHDQIDRFRENGQALSEVISIVQGWCVDLLAWDIELIFARDDLPQAQLGGARLGQDAWLGRPSTEATSTILQPSI